jgi:DNA-binding MarR family transcriptional regulator
MNAVSKDYVDFVVNDSPPPAAVTDDVNNFELWGILANTYYAILRSRFIEVSKIGLTPQKAEILHILQTNGGSMLQNQISDITMRRQHSVSDLVNRMVREGLISKKRLPNDRRYVLTIRAKGIKKHRALTRRSIEMIFSVLTAEDHSILETGLNKLISKSNSLLGLDDKNLSLPPKNPRDSISFHLWGVLVRANFSISRSRFHEIAEVGLTPEKAKILHIIQISGESISQNKISGITMRRQHSVSDLVNRMVREGLVKKTKHLEDRVYTIKMSKKGKDKYHKLQKNTLDIIFSVLTREERQNLHLVLNKLLEKSRGLLGLDYTSPF